MAQARFFPCPLCGGSVPASGPQEETTCPHCENSIKVPERFRTSATSNQSEPQVIIRRSTRRKSWRSYFTPLLIMLVASMVGFVVCSFVWQYAGNNMSSFIDLPEQVSVPTAGATPLAQASKAPATPTRAPAAPPAIVPTAASSGNILFQDNFSNPASGWERVNLGNHVADYVGNGYRIYIDRSYPRHLTWIGSNYGDVSIDVDAKQFAGPDDGLFGVICRAKAGRGSYAFYIANNGFYAIDKYVTELVGESIPRISRGQIPPNVVKPSDFNHISASCFGSRLTLYVNGQSVAQVDDPDFTSGGAGLIVSVGPSGRNGIDVLFNNFVVKGR